MEIEIDKNSKNIINIKQVFKYFDRDYDGFLNCDEIGIALRSIGKCITQNELNNLIQTINNQQPNPAKVSFEQFVNLATLEFQYSNQTQQQIIAAFQIFDKQNTGFIHSNELKHLLLTLGESISLEELDSIIADADPNNTGKINYIQYSQVLAASVSAL
eukprot:TRINITY_DN432_c0_g1_i1.p1 TRINITY_DN432_c0_g1~~TRINITY_DN432_c0_g1_i1.p1  ORF type:complete len:159 (-),score=54.54 TRINITY_DN432_c0_g1_i1:121-597(-)